MMRKVFPTITQEEVTQLFHKVDAKGSGYVDYGTLSHHITTPQHTPSYILFLVKNNSLPS